MGRVTGTHPDTVLLDLDGTLVDSAPGILGSLRTAFDELGLPWPEESIGPQILGPPLYRSLPPIVGEDVAAEVITVYRRHYAETGLLASEPYGGIETLLHELAAAGTRLALATSKAEVYAAQILEHRGWTDLFEVICGDTLDAARPSKAAVVAEALHRLGEPGAAVMVGDRSNDVIGAREHGIGCVGAGWGYGRPGELAEAGAVTIIATPAELRPALSSAVAAG
ncbi:HAD hydrolase-like protein [Pseudonocardia bannensis]|uniref:HAD hydrolase-like protein n=1 Tax=Pseudonocardia bannensis TaxID=630973 RepID=A0A848DNV1_9PSEU|nr:HAD hydrolase-like protein [Pseudonocardia bannensis]NMH94215.1 HAD hydrolase-like protein [Pseudonocardia bannensis]